MQIATVRKLLKLIKRNKTTMNHEPREEIGLTSCL